MARTLAEIQRRLNMSGLGLPKLVEDGEKGPKTTEAVVAFQKSKGIKETGIIDAKTLSALFPEDDALPKGEARTIQATITDWALNYAQSKIVWAAAALVAVVVGFIQTKFGIDLPPETVNWITSGLVMLGGTVIAILRGWGKDVPRVAAKAPAVIEQPTKYVGQKP